GRRMAERAEDHGECDRGNCDCDNPLHASPLVNNPGGERTLGAEKSRVPGSAAVRSSQAPLVAGPAGDAVAVVALEQELRRAPGDAERVAEAGERDRLQPR